MSLTTLTSVQKLQMALHAKAKESPDFHFYALYDKVYRKDVLVYAYQPCKANRGAAGVDNQTFEDIEQYGVERWLDELAQELKSRTYQPQPVRRVYIPKPDGKQRPLGIPTIRDRVVETAAVSVLEPIFEAGLQPEQYAYRADRSALDAVRHVHKLINTGHRKIVDADLSSYLNLKKTTWIAEPSSMSKDSETSSFNTYRKRPLNSASKSLHYRRLQSEFLESAA
jgi:RNA-directed DNA polymerase